MSSLIAVLAVVGGDEEAILHKSTTREKIGTVHLFRTNVPTRMDEE
jgi:hypothetical protein